MGLFRLHVRESRAGMPSFLAPRVMPRVQRRLQRTHTCAAFRHNVEALPAAEGNELHLCAMRNLSTRAPSLDLILRNEQGKRSSFRIFFAAASAHKGVIDNTAVREMLHTYAEVVDEAREKPGSHATVDFLLRVAEEEDVRFVCRLDGEYLATY